MRDPELIDAHPFTVGGFPLGSIKLKGAESSLLRLFDEERHFANGNVAVIVGGIGEQPMGTGLVGTDTWMRPRLSVKTITGNGTAQFLRFPLTLSLMAFSSSS